MSYDIHLKDPDTGAEIELGDKHYLRGGTYAMDGTVRAKLNITYNYSHHFKGLFGEKGIRSIYGMKSRDAAPVILRAILELRQDRSKDYWEPTEGNARAALEDLLSLGLKAPDGIWDGD